MGHPYVTEEEVEKMIELFKKGYDHELYLYRKKEVFDEVLLKK